MIDTQGGRPPAQRPRRCVSDGSTAQHQHKPATRTNPALVVSSPARALLLALYARTVPRRERQWLATSRFGSSVPKCIALRQLRAMPMYISSPTTIPIDLRKWSWWTENAAPIDCVGCCVEALAAVANLRKWIPTRCCLFATPARTSAARRGVPLARAPRGTIACALSCSTRRNGLRARRCDGHNSGSHSGQRSSGWRRWGSDSSGRRATTNRYENPVTSGVRRHLSCRGRMMLHHDFVGRRFLVSLGIWRRLLGCDRRV